MVFFSEDDKNKLLNSIINTNYDDENDVWDLALELEHISIVIRGNVLKNEEKNEMANNK